MVAAALVGIVLGMSLRGATPQRALAASRCHLTPQRALGASRRHLLSAALIAVCPTCPIARAGSEQPAVVATGIVTLQPGASTGANAAPGALYVTVRPAEATAGALQAGAKVVPLATARFAAPISFPFAFTLTTSDLTAEYAGVEGSAYQALDLTVSARLDGDGVAATRGPDDLVGRGLLRKVGSLSPSDWQAAAVELQGRGLAGRLLTGGAK